MEWNSLLCKERFGTDRLDFSYDPRSPFQKDIDRILFSSPFRRMQDKTQVFPIPKSDFIHNRLTHSIEVSSVGRSLGLLAGLFVLEKHPELKRGDLASVEGYVPDDFASIVAAACLAHDIGNPPFGHSGEKAIGAFFRSEFGKVYTKELNNQNDRDDLENFEGNAAGFRILTHSSGFKLTYATMGAFTKYPWGASVKSGGYVIDNKYGFFYSDIERFTTVAEKLKLVKKDESGQSYYCRHPLSFLMEAADTICYRIIDVEDSVKLRLLDYSTATTLLEKICQDTPIPEDMYDPRKKELLSEADYLSFLRAKSISSLIYQAINVWKENYDQIMSGDFNIELLKKATSKTALNEIKDTIRKKAFNHALVLKIELAGYEILGGLLGEFCGAAFGHFEEGKNEKLLALIPEQFLIEGNWHLDIPERLLLITDFVSNMTDSYAIDLYRNLKGINLSTIE